MKNETSTDTTGIKPTESGNKPGFFARLVGRIDQAMKDTAEKKASQGCCCKDEDKGNKGGKCC